MGDGLSVLSVQGVVKLVKDVEGSRFHPQHSKDHCDDHDCLLATGKLVQAGVLSEVLSSEGDSRLDAAVFEVVQGESLGSVRHLRRVGPLGVLSVSFDQLELSLAAWNNPLENFVKVLAQQVEILLESFLLLSTQLS